MSPFSNNKEYPPWAETMFRSIRAVGYFFAVTMGIGLLLFYPDQSRYPNILNVVCGIAATIGGTVCFFATLKRKWIDEWVALFFLVFAISTYVAILWTRLFLTLEGLAGASAIAFLLVLNIFRLAELTVFFYKTLKGAKLRRELGRRGH